MSHTNTQIYVMTPLDSA